MKFINTLPPTQNEFSNLHHTTRQRFVNLIKGHIDYFDNLESRITMGKVGKIEKLRKEAVDRLVAHHQKEIDIFKAELTSSITTQEPVPPPDKSKLQSDLEDVTAELRNARNIAKKTSREKNKYKNALKIMRHKPTQFEMKEIIDRCRFKNGKCNNTKVGEELGIDGETALAWIKNVGLSDYAYDPNHLK